MANMVTCCRIICSLWMLFFPAFSGGFYALYGLCGFTDMIDGAIARKTNTVSRFGAALDTVADFVFALCALAGCCPSSPCPGGSAWGSPRLPPRRYCRAFGAFGNRKDGCPRIPC